MLFRSLLAASAVAGTVLGLIAHVAFLFLYPLWGGSVIFEIRPEVTGAKEAVTREIVQDEAIARLALVRRDEFDAAHELAARARAGQEATEARIAALEARITALETKSGGQTGGPAA